MRCDTHKWQFYAQKTKKDTREDSNKRIVEDGIFFFNFLEGTLNYQLVPFLHAHISRLLIPIFSLQDDHALLQHI